MVDWKEYKLGNAPLSIIDGDRGKNYPNQNEFQTSGHCLFLSTKNVRYTGFDFSDCQFISKEKDELLRKGKLSRHDLVLTTRGTVGNLGFYSDEVAFENIRINSGMVIIRPHKEFLVPNFNFYIFRYLQKDFLTFTTGSAQPQLPIRDLNEIEIKIPPLREQTAIASILSSLDNKIDLLHRQNTTLEKMAETLFRQWFVEEAKEEWEEGTLSDFGIVITGKTPSKENPEFWGDKYDFVTPSDFKDFGLYTNQPSRKLSELGWNKLKSLQLPQDAILVTCIGSDMGKVTISSQPCITNQQLNSIIIKDKIFLGYVYEHIKSQYQNIRNIAFGGTTMPIINKTDFQNIETYIPPKEVVELFSNHWNYISQKIKSNQTQIRTLTAMRDTLLPKLMCGEVRVEM